MTDAIWKLGTPALEIAVRCLVVYLFVLVGLRLSGKREVGQMTPFDLVLILLLANSVQNAMVGPDASLSGGLIAAGLLLVFNFTLGRAAQRWIGLGRVLRGHATILINRGIILDDHLKREGIVRTDLMTALREHGVASPDDVRLAVLEVDGTISVLKDDDLTPADHKPHRRFRFLKHG